MGCEFCWRFFSLWTSTFYMTFNSHVVLPRAHFPCSYNCPWTATAATASEFPFFLVLPCTASSFLFLGPLTLPHLFLALFWTCLSLGRQKILNFWCQHLLNNLLTHALATKILCFLSFSPILLADVARAFIMRIVDFNSLQGKLCTFFSFSSFLLEWVLHNHLIMSYRDPCFSGTSILHLPHFCVPLESCLEVWYGQKVEWNSYPQPSTPAKQTCH